jgi:outer membrane receptor protein involved in Fe transport
MLAGPIDNGQQQPAPAFSGAKFRLAINIEELVRQGRLLACIWACDVFVVSLPVVAQTDSTQTSTGSLEEVVVTAQRREESLQRVPLSAQVVTSDLSNRNLNSLNELSGVVPGLHVEPTGRSSDMYVRGVGSGNNASFDQSVGLFLDDIYHGRSRNSASTFLDVERIEILKGPQSTYFGNNAIAGAINIVSRKPGDRLNGLARTLYGQDGQYTVESALGGPIAAGLAARGAIIFDGQDGNLRNVFTGTDVPNEDNKAGRLSLQYQPSAAFDALLKLEGGRNRQSGGLAQQIVNCPPPEPFVAGPFCMAALAAGTPVGLDNERSGFPDGQSSKLDTAEGVLTMSYRPSERNAITATTGFYTYTYNLNVAANASPTALLTAAVPETFHQFSQEVRLASETDRTLEYMAGLYFQDQRLNASQVFNYFFLSPMLPPALAAQGPLGQQISFRVPEKTYSVFGSVGWHLTDALKINAGLRGSYVEKRINQSIFYGTATQTYGGVTALPAELQSVASALGVGVAGNQSTSRNDKALMPSTQIQYTFTPTAMGYASYTRGFKAGGFNGSDTAGILANLPYDPEYVNAYEIGLKSKWRDDTVLINAALFRSDYSNLQVTDNTYAATTGAVIARVKNAASSVSQGLEIETRWLPFPKLSLGLVGNYLDARYDSYPNAGATQAQLNAGILIQDLSGRPTSLAPRWSGAVSAAYSQSLWAGYRLTTEINEIFSSSFFLSSDTDDPLLRNDGYTRLDARLSLQSPNAQWLFELIGKNLTNEKILASGGVAPSANGSQLLHLQPLRTVAVQVRYDFAP